MAVDPLLVAGMEVVECTLLDAGGQWRGEAALLALGGGGAVGGARSGGGGGVDHERAVIAGDQGCLGAGLSTPIPRWLGGDGV